MGMRQKGFVSIQTFTESGLIIHLIELGSGWMVIQVLGMSTIAGVGRMACSRGMFAV